MKYLYRKNRRDGAHQIYEVKDENEVLFDWQLEAFFKKNTPIKEVFGKKKKGLDLFLNGDQIEMVLDFSPFDYRLKNNPFQLVYPMTQDELSIIHPVQYVQTNDKLGSIWNFGIEYRAKRINGNTEQTIFYDMSFDYGVYDGNISLYVKRPGVTSHKSLKSLDKTDNEHVLRENILEEMKKDRLYRLFELANEKEV
jgi:hypothetical protein